MEYRQDDMVKSCSKLEAGLRLGIEGIHACQIGPFCSPLFWSGEEVSELKITKEMLVEKRKELFEMLNDEHTNIPCKQCHMVVEKKFSDVKFGCLGHIDLAATTICNLRCNFCGYTVENLFEKAKYDALAILKEFNPKDVTWDSAVDFNGGEPSLLHDLDEYIEFFVSRRIRIFFMSNSVNYSPTVYNKLISGDIRWVCTSLDAGTPSTYLRTKKSSKFSQVLENLSRYAYAGSQGGGRLSVKYIFTRDNCSDDDIVGFTYAMLAIRPQKVWLTFDFVPLSGLPPDSDDFAEYDYSNHICAYAKLFVMLKKHGIEAGHFTENHLATVSRHGKILLKRVKSEIEKIEKGMDFNLPGIHLKDFRSDEGYFYDKTDYITTNPLRIFSENDEPERFSLSGKKVLIVPTCYVSIDLLSDPEIQDAQIAGFIDRDTVLQGKVIQGIKVYRYEDIEALKPDLILIASHKQHHQSILKKLTECSVDMSKIAVYIQQEKAE